MTEFRTDLTDEQARALTRLCEDHGESPSRMIAAAVQFYLASYPRLPAPDLPDVVIKLPLPPPNSIRYLQSIGRVTRPRNKDADSAPWPNDPDDWRDQ